MEQYIFWWNIQREKKDGRENESIATGNNMHMLYKGSHWRGDWPPSSNQGKESVGGNDFEEKLELNEWRRENIIQDSSTDP